MRTAPLASVFHREAGGYRRPVVLLSYWMQARAGLDDARSLHAVNVAVHALNGGLLLALLVRVGTSAALALAAAGLFVAHPLQWAAVAYVSGRTDLLVAFFTLLALHATLGALRWRRPYTTAAGVSIVPLLACTVLAKENGVLAAPLVLALWWVERRETGSGRSAPIQRRELRLALVSFVVTVVLAAWVVPAGLAASAQLPVVVRLRAAGAATLAYLRLLLVPSGFHLDRLSPVGGAAHGIIGAAVAVTFIAVAVAFARRPTRARFAALALVLSCLPASNLFPIHPAIAEHWVFTGEHLAYLPLAALSPALALVAARLMHGLTAPSSARAGTSMGAPEIVVAVAAVALVAVWSQPLLAQQRRMSDAETAYRDTLAHSPSPRACFNLGVRLLARGDASAAAAVYERCVSVSPSDASVYVQLGVAYQRLGERLKSAIAYEKALELDPGDPYAWSNYASLEASAGLYQQAREKWERALVIEPGFAPALEGLSKLKAIDALAPAPRPPA
jgi:Tfp pilus assembly protein PilF